MNESVSGPDGAAAPRMSLRQRMLSPALEQQEQLPQPQQQEGAECSPGTSRRTATPANGTAAATAAAGSGTSAANDSGAVAAGGDAGAGGAAAEGSEEERLAGRLETMLASARGWAERSSRSLQAIDAELRSIDGAVAGLASEMKEAARLEADVKRLRKSGALDEAGARDLLERVRAARREMADAKRKAEPRTAGFLAEFLLGRFNVKMYRDGERYVLKSKYEQFKQLSALPFLALIALSFLFPQSQLVKSLFNVCFPPFTTPTVFIAVRVCFTSRRVFVAQSWCLLYYISLSCREQVLRANGSRIKQWWIVHHYISALGSIVVLFWPMASATYQQTQRILGIYSVVQVIVQEIQTQYQLGRLYKMVAMGKANPMDVTNEMSSHRWAPNIDVLYPFVTSVQLFQLYLAYTFFAAGYRLRTGEWQVFTMAALFAVLGVGNIIATNEAYIFRWRAYHPRRILARAVPSPDAALSSSPAPSPSSSSSSSSSSGGARVH